MAAISSGDRVFVAGGRGLVGSAVVRRLEAAGYERVITRPSAELDLRRQDAVEAFFAAERPAAVVLAAARVGGIHANATFPADFCYDNLAIQINVIEAAYRSGVSRFVFLGSSCIYPRDCPQPIREDYLLTGPLEQTNEAYAVAKIAGLKQCAYYRQQHGWDSVSLMPTNLYGPGDNFHPEHSHVIPGMMRRFHEQKLAGAERVSVWGTGTPRREFLHVDDLAAAVHHVLEQDAFEHELYNVGTGEDLTIKALAELMRDTVGLEAGIELDTSKPDGTPRKLLDVSRMNGLGWKAERGLRVGLAETYAWFLEHMVAHEQERGAGAAGSRSQAGNPTAR